ncbi:hypothetical protein PFISCL1PPCAC_27980, partial [Pristionchus fissidentatus]
MHTRKRGNSSGQRAIETIVKKRKDVECDCIPDLSDFASPPEMSKDDLVSNLPDDMIFRIIDLLSRHDASSLLGVNQRLRDLTRKRSGKMDACELNIVQHSLAHFIHLKIGIQHRVYFYWRDDEFKKSFYQFGDINGRPAKVYMDTSRNDNSSELRSGAYSVPCKLFFRIFQILSNYKVERIKFEWVRGIDRSFLEHFEKCFK